MLRGFGSQMILSGMVLFLCFAIVDGVYAFDFFDKDQKPGPRKGFRGGKEKRIKDVLERLNLTAEQQEQIKTRHEEMRAKEREIGDKLRPKMDALRDELHKEDMDMDKLNEILSEIKGLRGERFELKIKGILGIKEVLTPEQFEKFKEIEQERRRHRQEFRKRREGKMDRGRESF